MPRCLPRATEPREETATAEVVGIHTGFSWEKPSVQTGRVAGRMNSSAEFCVMIWPVCCSTFIEIIQKRFGASQSGMELCVDGVKAGNEAGSVPYPQYKQVMPSTRRTKIPHAASPRVTFGSDALLTILIFKWFEDTQVKPPESKAELGQTQCVGFN